VNCVASDPANGLVSTRAFSIAGSCAAAVAAMITTSIVRII
jgi:hypothetical protein